MNDLMLNKQKIARDRL